MTNKPFEVQDSSIVLNGVPLEITEQGGINIDGNPVSGGGSIAVGNGVGPSIDNVTEILINGTVTEIEPGLVGVSVNGVDGLVGNTNFTPEAEGDPRYALNINEDITLTVYQGDVGETSLGPAISLGNTDGKHRAGVIAIGNNDVGYNSKPGGVYIGHKAGWNSTDAGEGPVPQGEHAIAIGTKAAFYYTEDNSITLNATGLELNPTGPGFFIKPIREEAYDDYTVYYDPTSGEVTYAATSINNNQLTDDKEVKVTVGNTDYFAIVNRANNNGNGVEATAVAYDADGNLITLHISEVTIDQDDFDRLILSKFSDTGEMIWQKQIQQDVDVDTVHDLLIVDETDIIVGASFDNGAGIDNIVLLKFNSEGGGVWNKSYESSAISEIIENVDLDSNTINSGGTYNAETYDTILIIGQFDDYPWVFQETSDFENWTTLTTAVGAVYNQETDRTVLYIPQSLGLTLDFPTKGYRLVGEGVVTFQELSAISTDGTDIFVAANYQESSSSPNNNQGMLLKVSSTDGSLIWATKIEPPGSEYFVYGMDVGADGNPVVIGKFSGMANNAAWVNKVSGVDGTAIWGTIVLDMALNLTSSGGDVVVDSQNNIFATVNTSEAINYDGYTENKSIAHVVKLSSLGSISWARRIGPGPCASVATGIDCDDLGNVYLSAVTVASTYPIRDGGNNNELRNVLVTAKYSTEGEVLWQRYIESDSYIFGASRDEDTSPSSYNYSLNRGRNLSLGPNGKLAIQVTAQVRDADDNYSGNNYYESVVFQIDQDGREMTVGSANNKFTVKASRVPGKFVTLPNLPGDATPTITDITEDITVATPVVTLVEGELAQQLAQSAPYEYVFGNDGTLTIPNDGDIKLTQAQIGWFSIFGRANNDTDDIWFRANCVDPVDGSVYAVGQSANTSQGIVARYNSQGEILWSIILNDEVNGSGTRCNAVKIHPVTGNVVVLCEYFGNQTGTLLVEIEPDRAAVVRTLGFRDENEESGVNAYDFDFRSNGNIAVVGRKFDEWRSQSITPQTGSGVGVLFINNSEVTQGPLPVSSNGIWYVSGTGIVNRTNITNTNVYENLTGTTRQGSGAITFDILNNGSGGYVVLSAYGGTDYLTGHKVKILGTDLGGVTPDNDLIVEVTAALGALVGATVVSGTAAGTSIDQYLGVTGTNYNIGSGFQTDLWIGGATAYDQGLYTPNTVYGTNYVEGDVIIVPGTSLGGATPDNDLTVTVTSVGVGGVITGYSLSGTAQTSKTKITVGVAVDFSGEGSWAVDFDLGGECFIYVAEEDGDTLWNKVLSAGTSNDTERYFSVAFDANGNVYAAGEMVARDNAAGGDLNTYWCAVVSKFDVSGNHEWTKALNDSISDSYAKGVAVQGNTVAVSHYTPNSSSTVITKLDNTGTIKWQRVTNSNDDSSVAVDTNGDIYAVIEAFFENAYEACIKVIKFASNGEIVWRKFFGTLIYDYGGTSEYFKNGRNLTLDADHLYVSGYTTAFNNNYENAFLVKIPKSGDCDGIYNVWTLQNDVYNVTKLSSTEATAFTPVVSTGNFESWEPTFTTQWYDPSSSDEYQTFAQIVDRDGGAIEFADGTRQTSSAQQIPQRKIFNGADHRLTLDDMGKHIFVTNSDTSIVVPYNYDVPLPIGFTVVIINDSGAAINIDADGGAINVRGPTGTSTYWDLASYSMATLIKVDTDYWYLTGNVTDDA